MKIVVCVKQVPDTTEVKIDPVKGTMIREGVKSIINPDDLSGLEAALRIKDQNNAEVIALSMGPLQADKALREAISMGVDRAILLNDRLFAGSDTLATSLTLSKAIEKIDPDLIITGRQAIDGDTAQVGPQIAEHLNIVSIAYVNEINVVDNHLIVKRMFEDGYQTIKTATPCLLTTLKGMNKTRYMRVGKIYKAFDTELVEIWKAKDIEINTNFLGLKGSPTKVKKSYTKNAKSTGKIIELDAADAAKIIVEKLKENYILC